MKKILLLAIIMMLSRNAWADRKDITDPDITTKVFGFMLLDMLRALGEVHNEYIDPKLKQYSMQTNSGSNVLSTARKGTIHKSTATSKNRDENIQPKMESAEAYLSKTIEYKGAQMWGEATARVRADAKSFDMHITCTLPITMWTLKTPDGTEIGSERIKDSQAVERTINEPFNPPYNLYLNVVYMDMPNLIKVKMEKAK